MFNEILNNLTLIGCALLIFVLAYGANMCFSIWYNVNILKESFSLKKLGRSALKIAAVMLGIVFICSAITALPFILESTGLDLGEDVEHLINVLTIVGIILITSYKYIKEAYDTLSAILNSRFTVEEKETNPIGFLEKESEGK